MCKVPLFNTRERIQTVRLICYRISSAVFHLPFSSKTHWIKNHLPIIFWSWRFIRVLSLWVLKLRRVPLPPPQKKKCFISCLQPCVKPHGKSLLLFGDAASKFDQHESSAVKALFFLEAQGCGQSRHRTFGDWCEPPSSLVESELLCQVGARLSVRLRMRGTLVIFVFFIGPTPLYQLRLAGLI